MVLMNDPAVRAYEVTATVRNGVVALTGTVRSWSEYADAEKNAYQAGAKTVENKLDVSMENYYGPAGPLYYGGYTGNFRLPDPGRELEGFPGK
jgi:hypothetical protein